MLEVFIRNWYPATLNEMKGHWRKGAALKKRDRDIIWGYCQKLPKATGKRRVDLHLVLGKRRRERDYDNCWKSLLDALTHSDMLLDDRRAYVVQGEVTYSRDWDNWGTRITLTEAEGNYPLHLSAD